MRITKLTINHYKTIEEPIEISCFSHLQILIGPNNSGKTNVVDALEFCLNPQSDPGRFFDSRAHIVLTVAINESDSIRIVCAKNKRGYFLNDHALPPDDPRVQAIQNGFIRIPPDVSVHEIIAKNFKDNYVDSYRDFCETLHAYFDDIEINEKLFLENVAHVHTDRKDRPIARMGEGFKRLFVMLFYIFYPRYGIIVIDEPESHLHPSVITQFLKILEEKASANQIFVTTHSSAFAKPENIAHLWRVARDEERNTKVYYLKNCAEEFPKERLVQELNADNAEMFFADTVLLVEGVSDRILLRGLIDRFYSRRHDIKVIYTSGKGNIDVYVELLKEFHIPYALMLDQDAVTGVWSEIIGRELAGHHKSPLLEKIAILKQKNIFILEGTLEESYPRAYQTKDTKPLNALYAAYHVNEADLASSKMRVIKELIESL